MYRENNADSANRGNASTVNNDGAGGSGEGYGRGRGRGGRARGGGGGDRGGRGKSDRRYQPERFGIGYDPRRTPSHNQERIGRVCYDKKLARDNGKTMFY